MRSWAIVLMLACGTASAQSIVAVTGAPAGPIVKVNPLSGAMQTVAFMGPSSPWWVTGTLDSAGQRLFYVRGNNELTLFDLREHSTRAIPYKGPESLRCLAWDDRSQRVLALVGWPMRLIAIDVVTGKTETVASIDPQVSGILPGLAAFDAAGRRYFAEVGSNDPERLLVVDVATGRYDVVTLVANGHWFLRYDPNSGRLLTYGNACRPELRSLDPLTGDEEVLAAVPPDLIGTDIQMGTLDAERRRLFFLSYTLFGPIVVTFDLEHRTFQSVPFPLFGTIAAFEFLDTRPDHDAPPGGERRGGR